MAVLTKEDVQQIAEEIQGNAEETRRAEDKRRHDMYRDDARKFLIEQVEREFGEDSIREMRLAPINVLKKIVNKKSQVYKKSPVRLAETGQESDQLLIDYYVQTLDLNQTMQKANRYYNLFANTVLYPVPRGDHIEVMVVPPYLYSINPEHFDQSKINAFIFNAFVQESTVTTSDDLSSATGTQGFNRERGYTDKKSDKIASGERSTDQSNILIFWTDEQHFTTDETGAILKDSSKDDTQFINPIGRMPVINLAMDRDNEPWAKQQTDTAENCLTFQLGWSDLLTIAKHHGFSILTIASEEEPKNMNIGINKAVWLKLNEGSTVSPSLQFNTPNSPLGEYRDVLNEFLANILTTNDMNPKEVGGSNGARNFSSGFQALIEAADILNVIEEQKAVFRNAEQDMWDVLARWHNWMFDNNMLNDEARALGQFSQDFGVQIIFPEVKPIESEPERLEAVERLNALGLVTKKDMLRRLNPDLSDEEIDNKLEEIQAEKEENMQRFASNVLPFQSSNEEEDGSEEG